MDLLRRRELTRAKLPLLGLDAASGAEPAASVEDHEGDEVGRMPNDRPEIALPASLGTARRALAARTTQPISASS